MLYFDGIDFSEGIDVNKTSASKKCDICHYWYFLNYSLNRGSDYHCIVSLTIKNEARNLMQNADLTEKRGTL